MNIPELLHDPLMPTADYVPWLASHGACFCLPADVLTVPIPIVEARIRGRQIIWGTVQTPFGSKQPLFGIIDYVEQKRLPAGASFIGPDGHPVAAIIDARNFGFPAYTLAKIIEKARKHKEKLQLDEYYRFVWEHQLAQFLLEKGDYSGE